MPEIMDVITEPTKTAQTTAPVTEPSEWMTLDDNFRNGAPDNVKDLITKKGYKNLGQFFDSYTEMEKFRGVGEHLVIPEAEDAEGWENVYKQLGRPETHDKYEFTYDGDVEISEELTGQFKQFAHGLGLTQKQFDSIVRFQLDAVGAQTTAYDNQLAGQQEQNIQALKSKWGEANYEVKVKGARIIADSLGIYQTLEAKGLASDPEIISMLDTIATRTSEDVITPQTPLVPQKSAQERIDEIKRSEAFTDKFNIDHKKIMAEYMALNQTVANAGQGRAPRT